MIEPRCPDCISPEIEPDPDSTSGRWRCANCGECFDFEDAFVKLREAEDFRSEMEPDLLFHLHRNRAQIELRACDGALRALNPYSDVEELHRILDVAVARRVIEARRPGAALHAYLFPGAEPHPVLGVDPGVGADLVGPELALRPEEGEDPISYTVRRLRQMVDSANDLLTGRLHGAGASPAAPDPRAVGPRSHRPGSGRSPKRHYIGDARCHWSDGTMPERLEAEGVTILGVLTELGERIEAGHLDPEADTLVEVSVTWDGGDGVGSAP